MYYDFELLPIEDILSFCPLRTDINGVLVFTTFEFENIKNVKKQTN